MSLMSASGVITSFLYSTSRTLRLVVFSARKRCASSESMKSTNALAFSTFFAFLTIPICAGRNTVPSTG